MKRKNVIILIFLVLIFLSCESRKNAIYDLHVFRMELREHCADYSESDWNIAIEKYKDICERVDQMQLTREELLEIDKVKGEIAGYAATVAAQNVSDCIKGITEEITFFIEGFTNTFELPKELK